MYLCSTNLGHYRASRSTSEGQSRPSSCPSNCFLITSTLWSELLLLAHFSKLICHPRVERTLHVLLQHFWWPTLEEDVQSLVQACLPATGTKPPIPPVERLQSLSIVNHHWFHISLDFVIGSLPP